MSGRMRMVQRPRTRIRLSKKTALRVAIVSFSTLIVTLGVILNFSSLVPGLAAAAGDYRSAATGNWNSTGTWEKYDGTNWVAATATPTNSDGLITIRNGHTVTITASVNADELVVEQGASIVHNNGTFKIMDGTGTDLINNGTITLNAQFTLDNNSTASVYGQVIKNSGGLTLNTGSKIYIENGGLVKKIGGTMTTSINFWVIKSGGTYEHADNGNNLPNADWQDGSTCLVTGTTTSLPGNLDMSFYNFTWNCTGQTGQRNLSSSFQTVRGTLTIISTGTGSLLSSQSSNQSLTVSGDYIQQGGTFGLTESGDWIMYVSRNFTMTGGTFQLTDATASAASGNPTLNITGTLSITGATLDMSQYTGTNTSNGKGNLNLSGNLTIGSGGLLTVTSSGVGKGIFNFNGSTTQTYSNSGTMSGVINYSVLSGAILNIPSGSFNGSGSFTVNNSGSLIFSSQDGITSSGSSGCVQVSGTRTFNTAGNYTLNGSSAQATGSGFPATVNNLTINNSSGVTLSAGVTVSGTLTLTSGKVITGSNELKVTNTSTSAITGYSSSSYISGNLRRSVAASGAYDFPVGVSGNYELITVTLSSMTGFTDIVGAFTNANPIELTLPLLAVYVNTTPITDMLDYGYWTLTPNSAMTGGTYSVTLNEKGHTNSAATPASYCVLKRNDILSLWESLGTHNNNTQSENSGVASVTRSGLTSFSNFGIGKGGGPLPVTLISFDATPTENTVNCAWKTAAEINNDYFTIERSADGKLFSELTRVAGVGTSTTIHKYSYTDQNPLGGTSYYRLKQTDFNGKTETFKIVQVTMKEKQAEASTIRVSPNPFTDSFIAEFESAEKEQIQVTIFTISGVSLHSEKIIAEKGNNLYRFSTPSQFKAGSYILGINNGKTVWPTVKIICQK